MSKSPFELRAEILQLTKDYMDQQYHMNVTFAQNMFEQGKIQMEEMQKALTMYSTEDLIAKAKEMYTFVSEKK